MTQGRLDEFMEHLSEFIDGLSVHTNLGNVPLTVNQNETPSS